MHAYPRRNPGAHAAGYLRRRKRRPYNSVSLQIAMQTLLLRDFEIEARRRLDPAVFDYFAGGADDEVTVRENESAFARIGLVPRALRGLSEKPNLDVTLLGSRLSMPVLIAPTAFHRLAHPDGEFATARAAVAADTILIASMAATAAIEDIAAAARSAAPKDIQPTIWFQLNIQPDLGFTEVLVRRAEAAGCTALVVTVDSPAFGNRERDRRNGFVDLPAGLCCENMREPQTGIGPSRPRPIVFSPELSWEDIDWLRKTSTLPLALKGIAHPDDARLAIERGVSAIIVSNHGGRQLDTVPASIELLPAIVAAVDGRVPVLLDGGIRRGTDVVKAIALGAQAVGIGRPVLWGLAVAGTEGVLQVLEMLRSELARALTLCGCRAIGDVDRELVRIRP
jgi:4-hydroxymandelate oxidase